MTNFLPAAFFALFAAAVAAALAVVRTTQDGKVGRELQAAGLLKVTIAPVVVGAAMALLIRQALILWGQTSVSLLALAYLTAAGVAYLGTRKRVRHVNDAASRLKEW